MILQATIEELLARLRGSIRTQLEQFEIPNAVLLTRSIGSDYPDTERAYYGVSQLCGPQAGLAATAVFNTAGLDCLVTPFASRITGPLELKYQQGPAIGFPAVGFGTQAFAGVFSGPRPPEFMEFGTAASFAGLGVNVSVAAPDDSTVWLPELLVRAGERGALQHAGLNESAHLGFFWRRLVTGNLGHAL